MPGYTQGPCSRIALGITVKVHYLTQTMNARIGATGTNGVYRRIGNALQRCFESGLHTARHVSLGGTQLGQTLPPAESTTVVFDG
jgi:hypothetical protein